MIWVGRSIRRLEDPAVLTGQGHISADLPAAHWVRFVRSPIASGRIGRIKFPPHRNVITASDLQAVKPIRPMLHKFNYVPVAQPILAGDVVRFVGETIAAVYAPGKEEAEDFAELVEIEIAPLTPVTDARRDLVAGAPVVYSEAPANVIVEGRVETPDFEATRTSAHRLIQFEARSRRRNATPFEARGGLAAYDAASGRVALARATQMPHPLRTAVAEILGMPESDLRVITPDIGGGFGIEPVQIRRRNLIDRIPYTSAMGLVFHKASYRQTMEMAIEVIDPPAFRARQQQVDEIPATPRKIRVALRRAMEKRA